MNNRNPKVDGYLKRAKQWNVCGDCSPSSGSRLLSVPPDSG